MVKERGVQRVLLEHGKNVQLSSRKLNRERITEK